MKRPELENPSFLDNPLNFTQPLQKRGKRPIDLIVSPEGQHDDDEASNIPTLITTPESTTQNMGSQTQVSPTEIVNVADDDDDDISLIYTPPPAISRNFGTNTVNAISVEQYSEDRDLQLAIMASLFPKPHRVKRFIDLSSEYQHDDDDVQVVASWTPSRRIRKPFRGGPSITETGQSSNSKPDHHDTFMCEICVEPKPYNESFSIMGCTHSYCSDCMIKYVASKLQDNITQIQCPVTNCMGLLEPEYCRLILPPEVFDRWGNALCEAVILASEKFYCPFKDCSALLIDDRGGEVITQSECPNCRRLFCVQCKVAWHSDIECADFQKLNKDERESEDIMLMQLAKNKKWIRCPKCRFYVEKSQGCSFMRCRCGYTFCYNCGAPLKEHYCSNCKR
ncbi:hypothetical protein F0562_029828 [Nyssa sinensis]|uniref:RBR-type E3 ubiquitin transferase n=1 Tax=Nyssa sinensis TaxID=561372 RepID=A0A5J5AWR9_9ASTE|nr:hypothetical protein F0562_029828 [Nyssa sinensis]